MHPFPPGTEVETTEEYFKGFRRKVLGEVVVSAVEPPSHITMVKWTHQYGNRISEYQDKNVMMMTKDIQKRIYVDGPKMPERIMLKQNMLDDDELVMFYAGVPYEITDGSIVDEYGVPVKIENIWVEYEHIKDATFINCNPTEVKKMVTKDREGISSYLNVSIEEMDHLVEFAIRYQGLHNAWVDGERNGAPVNDYLRVCKEIFEGVDLQRRNHRP